MARTNRLTLLQQIDEERERAAKRFEEHARQVAAQNAEHQADLLKQEKSHAEQIRTLTAKHRRAADDLLDDHVKKVLALKHEIGHQEWLVEQRELFLEHLLELDPTLERFRTGGEWSYVNVQTAVEHLRRSRLVEKFQSKGKAPIGLKAAE